MERAFRFIYEFNQNNVDGRGDMKDVLGGKGAGLAEMRRAGLPVPPGFTISTEACLLFNESQERYAADVWPEVDKAMRRLEEAAGRKFGVDNDPLLLSCRSGAKISMPGMMDTVLNIGLNDQVTARLMETTGNGAFAYDCYRRLLQMFGDVVLGISDRRFSRVLEGRREKFGVRFEMELPGEELKSVCEEFKKIIREEWGEFPQDPIRQLKMATEAVFGSWNNPRAVTYRKIHEIPDDLGTAVNVQMMVFGNRGDRSGSGVGFTRSPSTGEKHLYGEYLPRSQGEEVVAGIRTPLGFDELERISPELYRELKEIAEKLEHHYREMQDFEFTIEEGKLYFLQTRTGKRTGSAAVRIATEMFKEGLIPRDDAIRRVEPEQLTQLLHPVFKDQDVEALATGLPASPGAAVGKIVFSADDAVERAAKGEAVILVRNETTPDDIHGMNAAQGILTSRGGMTSHAAVVARGMGKCCVVGCEELDVDEEERKIHVGGVTLEEGDMVSIDGNNGRVMKGIVEKVDVEPGGGLLADFMDLVREVPTLAVRANADTGKDAAVAREFGARGIGLCRTEHMFFAQDRLPLMQEMLLADSLEGRKKVLERLKKFQKEDFQDILKVMDGLPVTVRLLDPPLHEFLPNAEELGVELERLRSEGAPAEEIRLKERLLERARDLKEMNPMMGHRGCRLGITYPEITQMQVEALFEAACELKEEGKDPRVEVMIPLVGLAEEFKNQEAVIREAADRVLSQSEVALSYLVGTMIELPRAALVADEIARNSEFFSFGTNDLTQTTFGYSRDDAGRFIKIYRDKGILKKDPFQTLDRDGVGQLIRIAVDKGRETRPGIKLGICGEHGGDPASVFFCHEVGLNYVSCSPYRVPVAKLAAAQAAIQAGTTSPATVS